MQKTDRKGHNDNGGVLFFPQHRLHDDLYFKQGKGKRAIYSPDLYAKDKLHRAIY
jgi:hypothetical protein